MKTNTFRDKTISLFYILLAIFPFMLGLIVSVYHYARYSDVGAELFLVVLFGFGLLILISRQSLATRPREIEIIAIVVLLTVVARWLAMLFFDTEPASDFLIAFQSAQKHLSGPYKDLYSARFPYWGFYILTLSAFFSIFGATLTQLRLFNLFLSGLTAVGVYYLGRKVTGSVRAGAIASLVYAFWPADIMYKNVPTGEHVFAMLFPYACLLFICALPPANANLKRSASYLLLAGLMTGLLDLYRPVGIVLLIAFGMVILLWRYTDENDHPQFPVHKTFLLRIAAVIALVVGYWTIKEAGHLLIEHEAMAQTNDHALGTTLRVGLDPDLRGIWRRDIQDHIRVLMAEHDENYQAVNALLLQETAVILQKHSASDYSRLFAYKFWVAWSSDEEYYNWATKAQAGDRLAAFKPLRLGTFADPWSDAYLIFLFLFSLIGSLHLAFHRKNDWSLCVALFILGIGLVLLVSEVQPRYRSILFSSIPIFAAWGILAASRWMSGVRDFFPRAGRKTA